MFHTDLMADQICFACVNICIHSDKCPIVFSIVQLFYLKKKRLLLFSLILIFCKFICILFLFGNFCFWGCSCSSAKRIINSLSKLKRFRAVVAELNVVYRSCIYFKKRLRKGTFFF